MPGALHTSPIRTVVTEHLLGTRYYSALRRPQRLFPSRILTHRADKETNIKRLAHVTQLISGPIESSPA